MRILRKKFQHLKKFVRKVGIKAFHNIVEDRLSEDICGVDKFWFEIKPPFKYKEIIADCNQHGAGRVMLFYYPENTFKRNDCEN